MRHSLTVGTLVLLVVPQGCSQLPQPAEAQSASAAPTSAPATTQEPIEARLARQMAAVCRQATQLSYRVDITSGDPPEHIWCTARHGPRHELDLRVYKDAGLIYELHKRPVGATVKIRERNHPGGQAEEYEVPVETLDAGEWDVHCDRGLNACMFGAHTVSWLGPDADEPTWLEEAIAGSEYVGIREVGGFPCDVLQNHRIKGLTETFYLDRRSHVLRRWTQVVRGVLRRDRVFSKIELTLPENRAGE